MNRRRFGLRSLLPCLFRGSELDALRAEVRNLTAEVVSVKGQLKDMTEALDRLTASVAAESAVIDSAVTLLGTLAQEIRDNIGDDAALNALADGIDAKKSALADAVAANTPAAPPTEPPVEPAA